MPPPCASDSTNSTPVSTVIESTAGLTPTQSHQVNSTSIPVAVKLTVKVTPHSDTISKYLVQYNMHLLSQQKRVDLEY